MNRLKLFLENFIIYGIGGIIGKMIPFFMLPIITRLMPNSCYMGLNDMSNTILSFAQAFAAMGMYDAMFRMFFEKEDKTFKREICSSALGFTWISSLIVFLALFCLREKIAHYCFNDCTLDMLVVVTAFSVLLGATNSIVAAPARMENKRKIYLFTNFFTPLFSYSVALALLLRKQYIYALPIGSLFAAFMTELLFLFINRKWFSIKYIKWYQIKEMLSLGIPLLPNFLIYWLFNSCDRIMISKILGMDSMGVYAVGAKFGHISYLIYTAFAGGWQYFAFSTMRDRDQVDLTSAVFEYLGCLALASTMLMSVCSEFIFKILFGSVYEEASITIPYLFMAPLVQMLFQVSANQFLVIKKTWLASLVLSCGAVGNILLNAIFIPLTGIEGAAIATLSGFVLSTVVSIAVLKRMKLFRIGVRFISAFLLFLLYMLIWRIYIKTTMMLPIVLGLAVLAIYIRLYKKELGFLIGIWNIYLKKTGEQN